MNVPSKVFNCGDGKTSINRATKSPFQIKLVTHSFPEERLEAQGINCSSMPF